MKGERALPRRLTVLLFVAALTIIPISVTSQSVQDRFKAGPFVDNLVFNVFYSYDAQVLALQNDDIDIIDDYLNLEQYFALESSENIETVSALKNGYGYVMFNTAKYPLNITALRRAIAFALDKERISEEAFMNLSEPLDSCVPKINPFSIEGELLDSYYTSDIVTAQQLLTDAGFNDTDSDGDIEAPDGSEILLELFLPDSSTFDIPDGVGLIFETALQDLHINYTRQTDDWIANIYNRLYFHRDYDMAFMESNPSNFDVDWIADYFRSENADVPYNNPANFRNATFDSLCEQLLYSTEQSQVFEAAGEMQRLIAYECPIIVCYEDYAITAYRTDLFEGYVNDIVGGEMNWWTSYKVRLQESAGGPFNGTFRWGVIMDVAPFNPLRFAYRSSRGVSSLLYDSLIRQGPEGNDVLWLAESYLVETHNDNPDVPEGNTRFTFDIIQNATWTDGSPLTAEDIGFALDYYRNLPAGPSGSPMAFGLENMSLINVTSPQELRIEFDIESYWLLHNFCYKLILPKAVLEELGPDGWREWTPDPRQDPMLTSGPFNITEYVYDEHIVLSKNPDYFYRYTVTHPVVPPDTLLLTIQMLGIAVVEENKENLVCHVTEYSFKVSY
ncbi:MAG: ABC transporter substrate-binding protein [Candidatus Thorarchaeota archaeon]